ncbi:MAG: DUF1810 domain-containing protein [Candidatus Cryptobacteroides sp.]
MIIEEMTIPANDLGRFVQAQDELFCDYFQALKEVREGYKYTHWIWYIFPQLRALGHSRRAKYFGITDMDEAVRYMEHPVLSARLREITEALLAHEGRKSALEIFGEIDAMKVRSCMTLFDAVCPDDVFAKVLDGFYDGREDTMTTELLGKEE